MLRCAPHKRALCFSCAGTRMNKVVEDHVRRIRLRQYGVATVVVALFLALGYLYLPPLGPSSVVFDEVTGFRAVEGEGFRIYLAVRLDSNQEVLVKSKKV